MARNFPTWDAAHWDYDKGNLNDETKAYAVEAARRVKAAGGVVHFFLVARALEQANVDWLKQLVADGHRIGNHTYDHVNVLATTRGGHPVQVQALPLAHRGQAAAGGDPRKRPPRQQPRSRAASASRPPASARPAGSPTAWPGARTCRRC